MFLAFLNHSLMSLLLLHCFCTYKQCNVICCYLHKLIPGCLIYKCLTMLLKLILASFFFLSCLHQSLTQRLLIQIIWIISNINKHIETQINTYIIIYHHLAFTNWMFWKISKTKHWEFHLVKYVKETYIWTQISVYTLFNCNIRFFRVIHLNIQTVLTVLR